jgi:hypothetical protein
VDAGDPKNIALFVDKNQALVPRSVAQKALGKSDIWMDGSAGSFVQNKGSINAKSFQVKGFAGTPQDLIITYSPLPKVVGPKDTSVPSKANQFYK